ncbi:olfactory receptor 14A2-like [Tachyglossus aculeatus]|uniref:olfactory receptor 14A2-like n=1 Tax=Tachyglossus aculeatus TaxID=9261 RepID=UPI0018F28587|nr:olfactory receptor 14A2-like [Tachyglossus aculeatus]
MPSVSTVGEFLLLGFSEIRELQLVHVQLFLLVYLAALTGNFLIVAITALDRLLQTPMYFFLRNLSVLDLCYISVTVPKSVVISLTNNRSISLLRCVAQVFLVVLFAASELAILTVMSYHRYAAICLPLRYELIMNNRVSGKMAAVSWLIAVLFGVLYSASTFSLGFCGSNIVHQFFCDVPSLLKISCSEDHVAIDVSVTGAVGLHVACFVFIVVSYVHIFQAVLMMPATEGRAKAFSTCLPHLAVFTVFVSTAVISYLKPVSDSTSTLDLLLSMFYAVVPPTLNPLIYNLRNRNMKAALGRVLKESFLLPPLRDKMSVEHWVVEAANKFRYWGGLKTRLRNHVNKECVACPGHEVRDQPSPEEDSDPKPSLTRSNFGSSLITCIKSVQSPQHLHSEGIPPVEIVGASSSPFFCDVPTLLKLSCSEDHFAISVHIFWSVLRISATEGQAKTFSTFQPHLAIFTIFLSTAVISNRKPILRNRGMKANLRRVLKRRFLL